MEMTNLCSICKKPGAMNRCILCGRIVCIKCFDQKNQVCIQYKKGEK